MKLLIIFIFLISQSFAQINTSYVIKNVADLTGEMYVNAKQINTNTCRKSASGSRIILKFEGNTPEVFKGDQIYGHSAILQILRTEEWAGYTGGIASVGKFFITDFDHRKYLTIQISDWMYINPVRIKDNLWAIPYDLYVKYKLTIDNNIDLYKCVIRNVKRNELLEYEF